jgi:hypothetical protein
MITLINYAHLTHEKSRKKNSATALTVGGFDGVIEYGFESLPNWFIDKNAHILKYKRGAGYMVWKPFIIFDALSRCKENDYVFYCDAGSFFTKSCRPYLNFIQENDYQIFAFWNGHKERKWSKADAITIMNIDDQSALESSQVASGYIFLKNTLFSKTFVAEWLTYAQDYRVISDAPDVLSETHPDFIENRHDQTIFSLLCKKYGLDYFHFDQATYFPENLTRIDVQENKYSFICNPHDRS